MSAGARVAAFAGLLVAIFAAAALAGSAIDPVTAPRDGGHTADGQAAGAPSGGHGAAATADTHGAGHGAGAAPSATRPAVTADGLATTDGRYRLVAASTRFAAGRPAALRFRILDARGRVVRAFETEQERRMHLIVVRRDLRRYQHLHPEQAPDGAWSIALELPEPGVYRAFADFRIAGSQHVLGVDLFVPGDFAPLELPARGDTARVDGYDVGVHSHASGELTFAITRDGRAVADLQPYLGARGHLVALRAGDLAYRHSHPVNTRTANEIAFEAGDLEPGVHRLFLQFRHEGRVHTAAFTR